MAAVRAMMSVVKEEAAVITTEVAASARVGVAEAVAGPSRAAAEVVNPLAVRQTVEASVKEAAQAPSILAEHLSLAPKPTSVPTSISSTTLTTTTLEASIRPPALPESRSLISQTLEQEMGMSVREAISNAGQTGVEEQLDKAAEVAQTIKEGHVGVVQEMLAEVKAA
ncbi:hypothetical protein EHS25_005760 [Saitozyma podzolica]|uniref:Uncharacterized protein n=1 Tax=Saitozyma podzolica TaxID=1890683 RepID=A0A427XW21_9TREE|nr:hypothetical protein EHS25_005760 [Saitozyma podzolica]